MATIAPGLPGEDWNKRVEGLDGGFLQSREWGQFQLAIGRKLHFGYDTNWAWLAVERSGRGIRYLLASYGPLVLVDTAFEPAIAHLAKLGQELKVDFVRFEPQAHTTATNLIKLGAQKIAPVQPEQTWVLDLTHSEETLRHGLASGHRNRINGAEKRGVTIYATQDLDELPDFLRLLDDTARHSHIKNHPAAYYQTMAETLISLGVAQFYVASVNGQKVSISLVYDWHGIRYYTHTGNDQVLNRQYHASVYLVWQMILEAKKAGLQWFDFWGIAPSDEPNHPWAGITAFKKGFGGKQIDYLGTWDLPLREAKYQLYGWYRKLRGRQ